MIFFWQKPAEQPVPLKQVPRHRKKFTSNTETTTTGVNLGDFDYFLERESQVAGEIREGSTWRKYLRCKNATRKKANLCAV